MHVCEQSNEREDLSCSVWCHLQVEVILEVVHLTEEYWEGVVSYIIEEYRCGHTPTPDILCNTRIKFGAFMDAIRDMEYDYIASGHYAKVVHPPAGPTVLELSQDMVKRSDLLPLTSLSFPTYATVSLITKCHYISNNKLQPLASGNGYHLKLENYPGGAETFEAILKFYYGLLWT